MSQFSPRGLSRGIPLFVHYLWVSLPCSRQPLLLLFHAKRPNLCTRVPSSKHWKVFLLP